MTDLPSVPDLRERFNLTDLQARFVQELPASGFNASEAARRAGYSENSARSIGHENLTKPNIQAALTESLGVLTEQAEIRAEDVLEEYRRLAFSSLRDVVRWGPDGVELRDSDNLPDTVAAAVREVEVNEWRQEDGTVRRRAKVKMHKKEKALDKLGEFLELWTDRTDVRVELFQFFASLPPEELKRIPEMDDEDIIELAERRNGGPRGLPGA